METGDRLTWTQRRELERELWLDDHLRALADVLPEDLDDPDALRAIESRARGLAEVVAPEPGSKTIAHATLGTLNLLHLSLAPADEPDLRMILLLPADAATRERLGAIEG